ncbi:MAG: helix-turn-helix domain-containing protein [Rhizobium rhizophilum]|uniref:helix-turn-helix domain-containing protein n=1 Tax=Rhizobium rhizophilum TaxID=1850373 RepID=UPI00391DE03E
MDVRKLIGLNIRKLRVERGLSQERLALAAEIDRSYVGRIERGQENVTISVLVNLATALSVNVKVLFDDTVAAEPHLRGLPAGRKSTAS